MKRLFVDMRPVPMEIRSEVGFLILHKVKGYAARTIQHAVSDLLYLPGDDKDDELAGWYCFDGNRNKQYEIPIVTLHELFKYGGPAPTIRGSEDHLLWMSETADVSGEEIRIATLLSAKRALELAKHEWMTGENEERDNLLKSISAAAQTGETSIETDKKISSNTDHALEELGYRVGMSYTSPGKVLISWEDKQ